MTPELIFYLHQGQVNQCRQGQTGWKVKQYGFLVVTASTFSPSYTLSLQSYPQAC